MTGRASDAACSRCGCPEADHPGFLAIGPCEEYESTSAAYSPDPHGFDEPAAARVYVRLVQCDNAEPHPKHGWVSANEDIGCPGVSAASTTDARIEALERVREIADVMIGNGPGAVKAYYRKGGDGFPTGLPTMYRHLVEHAREIRAIVNEAVGDRA